MVFVVFSFCSPRQRGMAGRQSFEIKTDDTGARYITEKLTEQTKNYQGGAKQSEQSYSDVRMYESSTALDPVAAFEFYFSKTHPDCKALFQTPNKATTKNINFASTRHWYRNEPMGKQQGKSVQSQSTKMNGAFPTTSARQQVHKKESVQRF